MSTESKSVCMKGAVVTDIRNMTAEEINSECWDSNSQNSYAIVFDNGAVIYASRDPEGNGPGCLYMSHEQSTYYVAPDLMKE